MWEEQQRRLSEELGRGMQAGKQGISRGSVASGRWFLFADQLQLHISERELTGAAQVPSSPVSWRLLPAFTPADLGAFYRASRKEQEGPNRPRRVPSFLLGCS